MEFHHVTVLRDEAISFLIGGSDKVVLDGTLGGGGHSEGLLEAGVRVIGIDRDPNAIEAASQRLKRFGDRFTPVPGTFSDARNILDGLGIDRVDGVLLDLGVSSPQFDDGSRGFSFSQNGPLDMRMSCSGETARDLLERLSEEEIADVIYAYGEERDSRRIARAIKRAPQIPETTAQLASIVESAIPRKAWPKHIHPATKTFQALRIAVNHELEELDTLLDVIPSILKVGGRAAIISFHSLEDRRVKEKFRELEGHCTCPPGLPVCVCGFTRNFKVLTSKPVVASDEEAASNPRARSARLRALERIR